MSTKIYTGFRVKHNNPALLMKQLKELQVEYLDKAREVVSAALPEKILGDRDQEASIQKLINEVYNDRLMADVVIYFKEDKIIGQYFIYDRELEKKFISQDWFEDYHYQNQSDPDETVSEEDWDQRRKDWGFLDVPANDGFTFYILNPAEIRPFWISYHRAEQRNKHQVVS